MAARRFLQLSGFTTAERIRTTDRVSEAISQVDGWITDFHQYSNLLICINFEIPNANVGRLATSLQQTDLKLSQESLEQLIPFAESLPDQEDVAGTLQITFVHGEPDLYREVPAVPG